MDNGKKRILAMVALEFEEINGVVLCKLSGRIDVTNANTFKKDCLVQLTRFHPKKLAISCENLEYISSFGFRTLIDCLKMCNEEKVLVALYGFSPNVLKTASIIGFGKLYKVFVNQEQAFDFLNKT